MEGVSDGKAMHRKTYKREKERRETGRDSRSREKYKGRESGRKMNL